MTKRRVLAIVALAGMLLAACAGGDAAEQAAEGAAPDFAATGGDAAVATEADAAQAEGSGDGDAPTDRSASDGLPQVLPVAAAERVIKDGTIELRVEDGGFDAAFAEVIQTAERLGGSVISTSTRTADEGGTSGMLTVRVPVDAYEKLLVDVAAIGEVRNRSVTAEDVSTEFVDLQSRLRHLEAQERFYLGLLEEAETVQDAIAVQQQLDGLQSQIEQIKGRLQFLEDRTSFSTLTVELFEPGTTLVDADTEPVRPSFARYWASARDAFVNVVGAMMVSAVFLAPLAALAALGYAAWRGLRRRPLAPAGGE